MLLYFDGVAFYATNERICGNREGMRRERHPLHMADIEPLEDGIRCEWGIEVTGASILISGSKTDWPNQGSARSHSKVDMDSPHNHLCIVTALVGLY